MLYQGTLVLATAQHLVAVCHITAVVASLLRSAIHGFSSLGILLETGRGDEGFLITNSLLQISAFLSRKLNLIE